MKKSTSMLQIEYANYGQTLEGFVQALNVTEPAPKLLLKRDRNLALIDWEEARVEAVRLIEQWFASGPNTSKLFLENPRIAKAARKSRLFLVPTGGKSLKATVAITLTNRQYVSPKWIAMRWFLIFLLDARNGLLARPCAHCGLYFLKKTDGQKRRYCSLNCGHKFYSREINKDARKSKHADRLQEVREAIQDWLNKSHRADWKEWLAGQNIATKTWLTRAVNRGEISEPKRRRLS